MEICVWKVPVHTEWCLLLTGRLSGMPINELTLWILLDNQFLEHSWKKLSNKGRIKAVPGVCDCLLSVWHSLIIGSMSAMITHTLLLINLAHTQWGFFSLACVCIELHATFFYHIKLYTQTMHFNRLNSFYVLLFPVVFLWQQLQGPGFTKNIWDRSLWSDQF